MTPDLVQWLAEKASPQSLALVTIGALFITAVVKAIGAKIPRLADFRDWWMIGGLVGIGLGLAVIEVSVAGALAGLLCAVLATGGYEYLTGGGVLLKGPGNGPTGTPGSGPAAGPGAAGPTLLLLALLPLIGAGCMAPATVQQAQQWEEAAWRAYVANTTRITDLTLSLYEAERAARRERATEDALAKVQAEAVDGLLPAAEFADAAKALAQERENADTQTKLVVSRIRELIAANANEAAKALRIHGKMSEWLAAGPDASAIPAMTAEVAGLLQSFCPTAKTVPKVTTP